MKHRIGLYLKTKLTMSKVENLTQQIIIITRSPEQYEAVELGNFTSEEDSGSHTEACLQLNDFEDCNVVFVDMLGCVQKTNRSNLCYRKT